MDVLTWRHFPETAQEAKAMKGRLTALGWNRSIATVVVATIKINMETFIMALNLIGTIIPFHCRYSNIQTNSVLAQLYTKRVPPSMPILRFLIKHRLLRRHHFRVLARNNCLQGHYHSRRISLEEWSNRRHRSRRICRHLRWWPRNPAHNRVATSRQ